MRLKDEKLGKEKNFVPRKNKARNMIMVVSMMKILGEYTAVLTRVTEQLLPRRSRRFGGFRNLFSSTTSSAESASFLVYF
ncbi:hypothetical protein VNO80_18905 [Phaseolus coccineus]|uniref:Uncharacterized protein n=1 Tax=Phaseolus coccineus TaxID=3886 RepID=A0AAN9MJX3_PHACN